MLFNSYAFIFIYLPIALLGMLLLGKVRSVLAASWLGLCSVAFYAFWDARYVALLLGSILCNYAAGYFIAQTRTQRSRRAWWYLCVAVAANVGLLGYFKYGAFLVTTVNQLSSWWLPAPHIVLPLGISFFTFTQIAFLVDVYRGEVAEYSFPHYLLFVTYFPHLIAGPVLHHKQMMPQFADPKTYSFNREHVVVGTSMFLLGLAKKVLVADYFAAYAAPIFKAVASGHVPMFFEAWIGALAYTLQLYFDFSGYCDMAIGVSLLFNVRLPLNFNSPYKATSIIDFWRRWHMTLSAFLRDYIYIPLGGNREGPMRRQVNLLITMLIGGLWHGAGWTFVAWGGLHGLYLTVNHAFRGLRGRCGWTADGGLGTFAGAALTFVAVVVGWVLFRAERFESALTLLAGMAGRNGISMPPSLQSPLSHVTNHFAWFSISFDGIKVNGAPLESIAVGCALVWFCPNLPQMFAHYCPSWDQFSAFRRALPEPRLQMSVRISWRPSVTWAVFIGLLFFVCLLYMASNRTSEFLYFQF